MVGWGGRLFFVSIGLGCMSFQQVSKLWVTEVNVDGCGWLMLGEFEVSFWLVSEILLIYHGDKYGVCVSISYLAPCPLGP